MIPNLGKTLGCALHHIKWGALGGSGILIHTEKHQVNI